MQSHQDSVASASQPGLHVTGRSHVLRPGLMAAVIEQAGGFAPPHLLRLDRLQSELKGSDQRAELNISGEDVAPLDMAQLCREVLGAPNVRVAWRSLARDLAIVGPLEFAGLPVSRRLLEAVRRVFELCITPPNVRGLDLALKPEAADVESALVMKRSLGDHELDLPAYLDQVYLVYSHLLDLVELLDKEGTTRGKVSQAATAGEFEAMRVLVESMLERLGKARSGKNVLVATRSLRLPRALRTDLQLEAGDQLQFAPDRVSDLAIHAQRHEGASATGLRDLVIECLAGPLSVLLAGHRIEAFEGTHLKLRPLPRDPAAYHFEIHGSSPPWSVGEENNWLLDQLGLHARMQYNVLSIPDVLRIVLEQRVSFFERQHFYVAYDREQEVLLGSGFDNSVNALIRLNAQFEHFARQVGRPMPKAVSAFSEHPDFTACFDAYSKIRTGYYIWAYYSAFLDGRYDWVHRVLLLGMDRPGFKRLPWSGETLLRVAIGGFRLALGLPIIGARVRETFEKSRAESLASMHAGVDALSELLADGRRYMFGDAFSAADLHISGNMAAMLVPDEFQLGGILPELEDYPVSYRRDVEAFRNTRLGEYALRIYREHRVPDAGH